MDLYRLDFTGFTRGVFQKPNIDKPLGWSQREILSPALATKYNRL